MQNKKLLREYAVPGWTIPSGHSLLHAEKVRYIIRTTVRIKLYIYDREQVLQGVSGPLWTMFQSRTEYTTLERDGSRTKWRGSCFEHLDNDYFFTRKCAFYSQQDEARVSNYFHSEYGGIATLVHAQSAVLSKRQQERQRQRDRKVLERMEPVKALPRGLKSWVRRSVMPAHFFYDYNRKQKSVAGTCSLNIFNHKTNVGYQDAQVVYFDLKRLGAGLRTIAIHIINDLMNSQVSHNFAQGIATWCYYDEFHVLLQDELTASYFVTIWKMLRKKGGVPSALTQNVKALLASRQIENIFGATR